MYDLFEDIGKSVKRSKHSQCAAGVPPVSLEGGGDLNHVQPPVSFECFTLFTDGASSK